MLTHIPNVACLLFSLEHNSQLNQVLRNATKQTSVRTMLKASLYTPNSQTKLSRVELNDRRVELLSKRANGERKLAAGSAAKALQQSSSSSPRAMINSATE